MISGISAVASAFATSGAAVSTQPSLPQADAEAHPMTLDP